MEAMMQSTLTVRLSEQEALRLEALCEITGKSRSEVVRDSLRAYRLREALRHSQAQLGPAARAAGWLTEDDVLQDVS
jgi:predicted transcriptional regulator